MTAPRSERNDRRPTSWKSLVLPGLFAALAAALYFLPLGGEGSEPIGIFDFERFWTFDFILFLAFVLGLPILLMPRDGRGQRPALIFFALVYVVGILTHLPELGEESGSWVLAVALGLTVALLIAAGLARSKNKYAHVSLPVAGGVALVVVLILFVLATEGTLGEGFEELSDDAGSLTLMGALLILLVFVILAAGRWSRSARIAVILFSLAYFGFLQAACPRLPGAIELVLVHLSEPQQAGQHIIKVGLVLLTGLLFGRYYCGWICPKGVIQELIYRPELKVTVPEKLDRILKWGKYLMLILLILFPLLWDIHLFRQIGPFRVIFNLSGPAYLVIFLVIVLVTSVFIERAYCRYFCPEGGLLALAQLASPYRMRLDRSSCNCCQRCIKICPVDAFIVEDKAPVAISRTECIVCRQCQEVCRQGSLGYGPRFSAGAEQPQPIGECVDPSNEREG
jgi:Fe-S-cluster-containing hydrogenase component 2